MYVREYVHMCVSISCKVWCTHRHANTHRYRHRHRQRYRYKETETETDTHTDSNSDSDSDRDTYTDTERNREKHNKRVLRQQTHTHTHTHTHRMRGSWKKPPPSRLSNTLATTSKTYECANVDAVALLCNRGFRFSTERLSAAIRFS